MYVAFSSKVGLSSRTKFACVLRACTNVTHAHFVNELEGLKMTHNRFDTTYIIFKDVLSKLYWYDMLKALNPRYVPATDVKYL